MLDDQNYQTQNFHLFQGDALDFYSKWPSPTVIISDGPYGVASFPGDPPTPEYLAEWYEPHIKKWSKYALPSATLWFWNTEIGWATVHPMLKKYGWTYRSCNVWNKGMAHAAGNSNTQSLRKLPVVTEVCVQYVREVKLPTHDSKTLLTLKDWLRTEWQRTGLSLDKTNEACGVKNAATRKYFTKDHLWYFPPEEAFEKLVNYANTHGKPQGKPYFSKDHITSITKYEWRELRAKFNCPLGVTNVWSESAVRGKERLKNGYKAIHINQKPIKFMELIIKASSDEKDVVWEPFGGLCTGALVASKENRQGYCSEINNTYFGFAKERAVDFLDKTNLPLF